MANDSICSLIDAVSNLLTPIRVVGASDEFPENPNCGDCIYKSDGSNYIYAGEKDGWIEIQGSLELNVEKTDEYEYPMNCNACGAPIRINARHHSAYECPYCRCVTNGKLVR